MNETVPESGIEFEAMMREIDAQFIEDKVAIPGRPMKALMVVGTRYKIPMPLSKVRPGAPPELQRYAKLSEDINSWFMRQYGERLKVDMSVGRMVIQVEGDLYSLTFPRIFGQVNFVLSREFIDVPQVSSRGPALCNILQLVTDLTPSKASGLSDAALLAIGHEFNLGFHALDALEASQDQELVRIAKGDIQTAVANLLDRAERYGESKWASLQAAEKTLKAVITLEGAKFSFSHRLAGLCEHIETLGIKFDWKLLADNLQCTPGIRYGEEKCNRDEALAAHRASLQLVLALQNGGAKLQSSLARFTS